MSLFRNFFGKTMQRKKATNLLHEQFSEPLRSFINLVSKEPENFLWREDHKKDREMLKIGLAYWVLLDKKNRAVYRYSVYWDLFFPGDELSFLSWQENSYLHQWHKEAVRARKTAALEMKRKKYMDIYCKEKK